MTSAAPSAGRLRIAVVVPAETAAMGGVRRFAECLLPELRRRCDVRVVHVHPRAGEGRSLASRAGAIRRGTVELRRLASRGDVDGIITTFHWPPAVSTKVPMVGFVHDLRGWGLSQPTSGGWRPALTRRLLAWTWRRWVVIAVPSSHVAVDVRAVEHARSVVVVPEGLDHLAPAPGGDDDRHRILVLGGSAPHKRVQLGLDAAQLVHERFGMGIDLLGSPGGATVGSAVVVHRAPSDNDLADVLGHAAIAIAPSAYEGFGLSVGEAMRCGVPVVHAVGAHLEGIVADGGIACEASPAALAEGGAVLLGRLGPYRAAARREADRYRWGMTAVALLDLLEANE